MTKTLRIMAFGLGTALLAGASGAVEGGFQRAYQAGTRDAQGKFMGGTELFTLASHAGKLWASTGYYWDVPGEDPATGAQVLVLDRPGGGWRVDQQFDSKQWRASLDAVTFTTDGQGKKLAKPVSMLVSAPTDPGGKIILYSRDDQTGAWTPMPLAENSQIVSVRGVTVHRDAVTGVDRVLVGAYPNGVFGGVYDPAAPGRIRWAQEAELTGYGRPMGFAEGNGSLYLAAKPNLYRRVDGENPRWEAVYSLPEPILKPSVGLRGLTTIPNPEGRGQTLLAALDGNPASILRIDPAHGHKMTTELDVLGFLEQQWGRRPSFVIPAYNGMTPVTDPRTGETVHLLGLAVNFAALKDEYPKEGWEPGGWYLIRRASGHYELRQILDSGLDPMPKLVATRHVEVSPFGDRRLYFAGYDPHTNRSHNTAWIFAAPPAAALGPQIPAPPATPASVSIGQIQGEGQFSPLKGRIVETSGVVTLITTKKDGFWIQDPAGDGNPATSDGLFVFGFPSLVLPSVGDSIKILGRVEEEQKGNELPRTRLVTVQSPEVASRGNALPAPVPMTKLPDTSLTEGIAFWESLEGMRVSVENAPVIAPNNRFREFHVVAPGNAAPGAGYHPETKRLIMRSLGGDQVDYDPERIMIGDASVEKPEVVNGGDEVVSLVGVVDYTFGYYKIQPESLRVNRRETPKPPVSIRTGPAGNLVITTYNLWDFFTAVPQGKNERYVLKPDELAKRIEKIAQSVVTELRLPEIITVQELEGANLEPVIRRINELAGDGHRYESAWLPTSDWRNLTVAYIYDSQRVTLQKLYQFTGGDTTTVFGQKSAVGNREPLVGIFQAGPGTPPVMVIANKLKTKRAEESPFSLELPFRFTEIQRKAQVRAIRHFLNSVFEKDPNAYVVVTGDLGDFDFAEPGEGPDHPVAILKGLNGEVPMTNLANRIPEAARYDYIFQGQGIVVSHTLVSPALLKTFVGADFLHFNTPFPDGMKWDTSTTIRASDRDPLEARFELKPQ